jgi:hypothetical protein
MAIDFQCACGQPLQIGEEFAGRQVRCPACNNVATVPAAGGQGEAITAAPPPRPAEQPPAGMVQFNCSCGKPMQARSQFAGERVRCPDCGAVVIVPGDRAGGGDFAPPRRPGPPSRRRAWPWVAGLAALLLVGAGVASWFIWFKRKATPDLDLVPRDAVGFVSVRVADWWNSESGKQVQLQVARFGVLSQMESQVGLTPADIERVTLVFPTTDPNTAWGVAAISKSIDEEKLRKALVPRGTEVSWHGKTYYANRSTALYFPGKNLVVMGAPAGVQHFIDHSADAGKSGPLGEALKRAAEGKHHLVAAVQPPAAEIQRLKNTPPPRNAPPERELVLPFLDLESATLTANLGTDFEMDVRLKFPDEARAKKAQQSAQALAGKAREALEQLKKEVIRVPQAMQLGTIYAQLDQVLRTLTVEQDGSVVHIPLRVKGDVANAATLTALLVPSVQKVRQAAARTQSVNNLRQLAIAMHNYNDTYMKLPAAAYMDPGVRSRLNLMNLELRGNDLPDFQARVFKGKPLPLLSWRVAILPFIEQENLYRQFKLDEPWDSEHNKKLLPLMPKVFAPPGVTTREPYTTFYQVFVGKDAPFDGMLSPRIPASFPDGTSNTFLIVEAAEAVPWTKPADIAFDGQRVPSLGGIFPGGFNAALADAAVYWFDLREVSPATLKAGITPAGNEVMGADWPGAFQKRR